MEAHGSPFRGSAVVLEIERNGDERLSASNHSRTPSFFGNPASVESDTSSLMEPGSGIYVEDESLGNFVKMVDSARSLKDDTSRESDSGKRCR